MESISSITRGLLTLRLAEPILPPWTETKIDSCLRDNLQRHGYASGYLLYLLDRTLMAQAFDPERGQLKGDAQPVAERVASDASGNGFFDVSENGVLIYQGDMREERRMTWFDRAGKELGVGEGGSSIGTCGSRLMGLSSDSTVIRTVKSGWTNWRAVSACASQTILGLTTALRSGRRTAAGFCSAHSRVRLGLAFTR